jgi:hypothetical protein
MKEKVITMTDIEKEFGFDLSKLIGLNARINPVLTAIPKR